MDTERDDGSDEMGAERDDDGRIKIDAERVDGGGQVDAERKQTDGRTNTCLGTRRQIQKH